MYANSATLEPVDFELPIEFWSKQNGLCCDELWHLLDFADRKKSEICNIDFFNDEQNVDGLQPLNTNWHCLQTFFLSGDMHMNNRTQLDTNWKKEFKMDF